jgi:hypothetical protein
MIVRSDSPKATTATPRKTRSRGEFKAHWLEDSTIPAKGHVRFPPVDAPPGICRATYTHQRAIGAALAT